MGLTNDSVGIKAVDMGSFIKKNRPSDKVVALAGNPNVGKSTLFNTLTGMKQHTGNWPGKTVSNAQGYCSSDKYDYVMVDIPGTYSLMAHSAEEAVARNFICFEKPDVIVIVCDATCLERNLNLVLQILEVTDRVVVCVNLVDEARRKHISIDFDMLSAKLGVPVVGTIAKNKKSLKKLMEAIDTVVENKGNDNVIKISYPEEIEKNILNLESSIAETVDVNTRWLSLRLLDGDDTFKKEIKNYTCICDIDAKCNITHEEINDIIAASLAKYASDICCNTVKYGNNKYNKLDRKIDSLLTGKITGYAIMLILLVLIFWITISAANYPSQWISNILFYFQNKLTAFFKYINAPNWLHGILVLGLYRVMAWIVSVMLPPMAIFFPLFTLLEDIGYLPRIAYNLDRPFKKCNACGKQALTMCMGFGCNAAGVVGCRIIDSPRERLLAILTNTFVPCNGRFPILISIITMFFVGMTSGVFSSIISAVILTVFILISIFVTFLVTKILSVTLLKGLPSSFILEMPSYRKPQIFSVIVRSVFDRTVFVLGRAITIAAPAGIIIWLMANVTLGEMSLLAHCAGFLDPFARIMGLDGIILMAFILGFPANEIVFPIIIMAYTASGSLSEVENIFEIKNILIANGWTWVTAVSTMLFSLMHWPCSTTLLTIRKETGSIKWTALSVLIPTIIGVVVCTLFSSIAKVIIYMNG